jgi:hypothetical protein
LAYEAAHEMVIERTSLALDRQMCEPWEVE